MKKGEAGTACPVYGVKHTVDALLMDNPCNNLFSFYFEKKLHCLPCKVLSPSFSPVLCPHARLTPYHVGHHGP